MSGGPSNTREVRDPAHYSRDVYRISRGKSLLNSLSPVDPSSTQSTVGCSVARMSREFISVGEALKLVPPFKGFILDLNLPICWIR